MGSITVSKYLTVVIIVAICSLISCRPSPQEPFTDQEFQDIKEVFIGEDKIIVPDSWAAYFGGDFAKGAVLVRDKKENSAEAIDLKDLIGSLTANFDHIPLSQQETYRNSYEKEMDIFDDISLYEGKIYPLDQKNNEPQLSSEVFYRFNLLKYKNSHLQNSKFLEQEFYGVIELPNDQALLIFGDKRQVVDFASGNDDIFYSTPLVHSYQALYTDKFNQSYSGKGLLFILGSYMVQRLWFNKTLNINLELTDLVYKGAEIKLDGFVASSLDLSTQELKNEKERFAMKKVKNFGDKTDRFSQKSFSMLYTNSSDFSNYFGEALGISYIGFNCFDDFKSMWVRPFQRTSTNGYGRYILDAHEISHVFGSIHNSTEDYALMHFELHESKTQFLYFPETDNVELMKERRTTSTKGKCLTSQKRSHNINKPKFNYKKNVPKLSH